jgi:NADH dehydrogenase [ubiquinone] 1 alpha subcomplex assembly factor 7
MSRTPLEREIARMIEADGPMPVSRFMALCLGHPRLGYYMTRDPFGAKGDFVTAPEVSQMFGELMGVWAMTQWRAMGSPSPFQLVELGPGRGTLMMDLLRAARAMPGFIEAAQVRMIEMSPILMAAQKRTLAAAGANVSWHGHLDEVPSGPMLLIANEFFDALPVVQIERTPQGFFERAVGLDAEGKLQLGLMPVAVTPPEHAADAAIGAIVELSPARVDYAAMIAARLVADQGAALIIDYGHGETAMGDTLQAVRRHQKVSILERPGETDITAHVDFEALGAVMRGAGADVHGVLTQQTLMARLGLQTRAEMLSVSASARERADIVAAVSRLAGPHQMGQLFKAMAVVSPGQPAPAAFGEDFT